MANTTGGLAAATESRAVAVDGLEPADSLAAFDSFVRLHWARVYRYALASLRDPDAAASVAQDCFWKAYCARAGYRGEASVQTWLMRIAVNLVRDQVRSRRWKFWRREQGLDEQVLNRVMAGYSLVDARLVADEQVKAIWHAAGQLPGRQREVFLLRFVDEMELLEIARVAGLSEGAVKNHLFRAIRNVRRKVGGA
jgi:RNA polymerase sigma-70 factor, ECF subfamily